MLIEETIARIRREHFIKGNRTFSMGVSSGSSGTA